MYFRFTVKKPHSFTYSNTEKEPETQLTEKSCKAKENETSRERPKSAPYPRLKNSKRTSNFQVLVNWENFYEKKFFEKSPTMPKKTERGGGKLPFGLVRYCMLRGNLFGFPYPRLKNSKRTSNFQVLVNWENFYEKKFFEKSPTMPKKTERGGQTTLWSRPVLYVTRKPFWFSSLGHQVHFGVFCKFCRTFGRTILVSSGLFWSLKKTLTKSHDYSRLFS